MAFKLAGGIGLFLMGLVLLTDGLKAYAGDALRRALVRFTGTPAKAFLSGALATALVQSSSATTVTVIGFVSAGLLTFPQAVGVVFGASLGTTATGWIVAGLGLKISVGFYALPLVGIGAFLNLLGRGRARSLGLALAGFGIIFIGIETMQDAMRRLAGQFDFARLPAAGWSGRLIATGIGFVLTVLMQSSSAAVATTLTALHAGAINFDQSAALVIGAAIGTTTTGALAAIGGNTAAKRTALAHISFNLATGLIALALLPAFLRVLAWAQVHAGLDPGAMSLAAFHTLFIALGAAIFLPIAHSYARAIERLLPDRGPVLTRHLDDTVLHAPSVALEAARRALRETAALCFDALRSLFANPAGPRAHEEERIREAIEHIESFFARIPSNAGADPYSRLRVHLMHAIDHLIRLRKRLAPSPAIRHMINAPPLAAAEARLCSLLEESAAGLRGGAAADWLARVELKAAELAEFRRKEREAILESTAGAATPPARALELLDAIRWLDRIGYHTWRLCHYLGREDASDSAPAADARTQS
jgi:phosphate:Na+ symporter